MSDSIIEQARMDAIQGRYAPPSGIWSRRIYDMEYERERTDSKRLKGGGK